MDESPFEPKGCCIRERRENRSQRLTLEAGPFKSHDGRELKRRAELLTPGQMTSCRADDLLCERDEILELRACGRFAGE